MAIARQSWSGAACLMGGALANEILVVEDDPDLRQLAAAVLEEAGFRVRVAGDGMAAFVTLEAHPGIELLFTDILMPRIDGLMLADMAKRRRPDLRVLYATGHDDAAARQPGYRHGMILHKPYRAAQLEDAVRRALDAPPVTVRPELAP